MIEQRVMRGGAVHRWLGFGGIAALAIAGASPLAAQIAPAAEPICADRPGLGTPPCATPGGRVVVEVGLAGWTLNRDGGDRSDTVVLGDTLVRLGLGGGTEVQLGWTAFGTVRERGAGGVSRRSGVGDVSFGVLKTVVEGDALSLSALARATAPVGSDAIGAGDWSFDFVAPASIALGGPLSLDLTPGISAAADGDGSGRHLAYGTVVGIGADIGDSAIAAVELGVTRDDDPDGAATPAQLGLSAAWRPAPNLQLDAGANLGLNGAADDLELYVGISRQF